MRPKKLKTQACVRPGHRVPEAIIQRKRADRLAKVFVADLLVDGVGQPGGRSEGEPLDLPGRPEARVDQIVRDQLADLRLKVALQDLPIPDEGSIVLDEVDPLEGSGAGLLHQPEVAHFVRHGLHPRPVELQSHPRVLARPSEAENLEAVRFAWLQLRPGEVPRKRPQGAHAVNRHVILEG